MIRSDEAVERGHRVRTVLICAISANLTLGLTFGTFGPLLAANEAHFGVSRAEAALFMSLITLALGGLSPLLGSLIHLTQVRYSMMAVAALTACGYGGIALTESYAVALMLYPLIGIGIAVLAIIGPLVLVSRWFETNRGKVLALICLPVVLFVSPFLTGELLPQIGRKGILLGVAACFVFLIPLLLLIVERPGAQRKEAADAVETASAPVAASARHILTYLPFWTLSLGIGIMAGVGVVGMVHLVPFGVGREMTLPEAASLISIHSGAGLLGTPFFGWLSDRSSPFAALVVATVGGALCWAAMVGSPILLVYALAACMGLCAVPINPLHAAAIGTLFGPQDVSKAIGYSYLIKLPFLFLLAPIAGWMFEATGGYRAPFMLCATLLLVAAFTFFATAVTVRRRAARSPTFAV